MYKNTIGVGAGAGKEKIIKDGKTESTKTSANGGVSVYGVNVTTTVENEKESESGKNDPKATLARGIGTAIGLGFVMEYNVQVGVKLGNK